jgi:hypothetical protein
MTMKRRIRHAGATSACVLAYLAIACILGRIGEGSAGDAPPVKEAQKPLSPPRRVPPYFGQLGLSSEQTSRIYSIQAKRLEKIDALEKQIAAEKAGLLADCEGVLTDTQKKLLDNLRKAAADPTPKQPAGTSKTTEASRSSD